MGVESGSWEREFKNGSWVWALGVGVWEGSDEEWEWGVGSGSWEREFGRGVMKNGSGEGSDEE